MMNTTSMLSQQKTFVTQVKLPQLQCDAALARVTILVPGTLKFADILWHSYQRCVTHFKHILSALLLHYKVNGKCLK